MRTMLFTGKGGVGKTTVAAATALRAAEAGHRTLVLSTDPAHSLADAIDQSLGSAPTQVAPQLWAQQLDASERFEEAWGDVQGYLVDLLGWAGMEEVEAEELSVLPGLDEIFALTDIERLHRSGAWEVLVVDCAPTAETIRLLSLPDVLGWYMRRVFPLGRQVAKVVRPVLSKVDGLPPVADDQVFRSLSRLFDRLEAVRSLLTDTRSSTVRLVVNPERMVIAEARRTATYLALFGYRVDAVVANRLLPEAVQDPWFKTWRETQTDHLAAIEDGFAPIPILRADLAAEELIGVDRLSAFAEVLYRDRDAAAVLHDADTLRLQRRDDVHVLGLPLPFCDSDELEVARRDGDLLIRIGPYRRAVALPDSLIRRRVAGARMRTGWLEVSFRAVDG